MNVALIGSAISRGRAIMDIYSRVSTLPWRAGLSDMPINVTLSADEPKGLLAVREEHAALQRQFGDLGSTQSRRQKEPHVIHNRFNETRSVCHVIDYAVLDALVSEF